MQISTVCYIWKVYFLNSKVCKLLLVVSECFSDLYYLLNDAKTCIIFWMMQRLALFSECRRNMHNVVGQCCICCGTVLYLLRDGAVSVAGRCCICCRTVLYLLQEGAESLEGQCCIFRRTVLYLLRDSAASVAYLMMRQVSDTYFCSCCWMIWRSA